jgi:hypothetical protein
MSRAAAVAAGSCRVVVGVEDHLVGVRERGVGYAVPFLITSVLWRLLPAPPSVASLATCEGRRRSRALAWQVGSPCCCLMTEQPAGLHAIRPVASPNLTSRIRAQHVLE